MKHKALLVLLFLTILAGPARGQAPIDPCGDQFFCGLYRASNEQGWEAMVRIERVAAMGPNDIQAIATLYERDGRYRSFQGRFFRGGLNVPFLNLSEAENPFLGVREVGSPLSRITCQVVITGGEGPGALRFRCSDGQGNSSGGLLTRIR